MNLRNIIITILIGIGHNLIAQTIIPGIYQNHSKDQVFVQTDRNKYLPGDTVYFQSYIRDRFSGSFESSSSALYVILYNDQGQIVDSSRFRIINATSPGWLAIPPDTKPGIHHLAAFTSMIQNFDPSEAFHLELTVEAPENPTLKTETKDPNFAVIDDFPDLQFLPEGGNLVSGVEQLVGFNAVDRHGVPVYFEGLLKKGDGRVLDTIESGPYGPGKFTCVPENGMYVELIRGAGHQKTWPLPTPDSSGIALSIKSVDRRSFAIEIHSKNYCRDTVLLLGTMNMQQIFAEELKIGQKNRFVIKTDNLPAGIAVITLFNNNLQPIAQRLEAINTDERLRFSVKTTQQDCDAGSEVELAVNVTDQAGKPLEGIFSIAVTDSASGYDSRLFLPGIECTLNYNPFFPSNLPPGVLNKGLQNLTDEQLDLMLMIYGWCKFNLDYDPVAKKNDLINYDQLKLKLDYASGKHIESKLDLISLEGPIVMHLKTTEVGELSIPLDSLPETIKSVTLMPTKNSSNRIRKAMLSIPSNEQFLQAISHSTSLQSIAQEKSDTFSLSKPAAMNRSNISGLSKSAIVDKTFELPEVTISAAKKIEYLNKYEEIYKYANVKSLPGEQISKFTTLGQAIRNIVPSATIFEPPYPPAIYFRQSHSLFGPRAKALIVLDGMTVYGGWAEVRTLPTNQIKSISILYGAQGHLIYGEDGSGGVIFIETNRSGFATVRTDWKVQNKNKNLLTPISIFRQYIEFYNPTQSEIVGNPVFRDRPTIYWNPEVYFDGKAPVKLKYTNPKCGSERKMKIIINGVSSNNLIGTANESYSVLGR
jgi:hypothetical protein